MRHRLALVLAALLVVALAACGADTTDDSAASSSSAPGAGAVEGSDAAGAAEPVVREILAEQVDPPGAPGMTLSLVRYTIAAGAELAPHVHPGIQMAFIESGTLSYTVESGTAVVRRSTGAEEEVTGPASTTIEAGESVVEVGDMVHFGANQTGAPIVILATLLTEDGAGLSVPVAAPTDPTPSPS